MESLLDYLVLQSNELAYMKTCFTLIGFLSLHLCFAQIANFDFDQLFQLYRNLHKSPELSLNEEHTSKRLAKELDEMGLKYIHPIGGTGIAGVLENGKGPTILLRTDMDALPIDEQTEAAYKSENTGVMHACGHDVHMTVWIGTLQYLVKNKDHWKGRILFVAQPAEEIGQGAKAMMQDDIYNKFGKPDLALALHTSADIKAGQLGVCSGWFMANVDMLKITVQGRGGHGASPHETIDPIVLAAKMVLNLQTIVTRELKPTEAAVITVGAIHGGTAGNIIPDKVDMELTVRSYGNASRTQILNAIKRTCELTAASAGVPEELYPIVEVRDMFTPALYNDPELAKTAKSVFMELVGGDNVVDQQKLTIGEDFSRYGLDQQEIPVFMFNLGTVNPEQFDQAQQNGEALPKLHSSKYLPDYERAIPIGVEAMTSLISKLSSP